MNTSTMIHRLEQSSESTGKYIWTNINKNTKNNTAKRHRTEDYNILQGSIQRLKQLKIRYQCRSMAQQYVSVSYGSGFYDIEAPPPNQEEEDNHEEDEADEENQLQTNAKERKNAGKERRRFEKYKILQGKLQKFKKANQCENKNNRCEERQINLGDHMELKIYKADYVIDINP